MRRLSLIFVIFFLVSCGGEGNPELMGLNGFEKLRAEYQGKVLIVNVFASWCPPCKEETPDLVKLHEEAGDGYAIVGLSVDKSKSDLDKFIKRYQITYPVYSIDEKLQRRLFADKIPVTVIYRPNGAYHTAVLGAVHRLTLKELIKKAGA